VKKLSIILMLACLLTLGLSLSTVEASRSSSSHWEEVPTISVKDPLDKTPYSRTGIKIFTVNDLYTFYNHCCPTLIIGLRACMVVAGRFFADGIIVRGDLRVVTGNDHGPVAAISYITAARLGGKQPIPRTAWFNGKMVYDRSVGEKVFIFQKISTGKALKMTLKININFADMEEIHQTIYADSPEESDLKIMWKLARKWELKLMALPVKDLFEIKELKDFNWEAYAKKAKFD